MKKIILFVVSSLFIIASVFAKADDSASTIYILFIGNSYTFVNNLPGMLYQISKSDPKNPTPIQVAMAAKGAATLLDMWNDNTAQDLLKKSPWQFVVLQDQSYWAVAPGASANTAAGLTKWKEEIAQTQMDASPVFFVTWRRKPGSDWYTSVPFLRNPEYMQRQIMERAASLVQSTGIPAVYIADYWVKAEATYPSIELYASDGSHPSPAGTYLTALVFYRYFTHRPLDNISYHPDQVSDADAQSLREIASQ